jgi:predicted GNAT family acetyltransferase
MIGSANDVVDDHDRSRFVLEQAGSTAELVYRNEPGRLIRINTDVPDPFAGRGIGGRLVQAAIERAKTRPHDRAAVPLRQDLAHRASRRRGRDRHRRRDAVKRAGAHG